MKTNAVLIKSFNVLLFVILLLLLVDLVFAGSTGTTGAGTEFNQLVTRLQQWAVGGLGRAISLAAVIVGAIGSVIRSNPLPILSGIAFAVILNVTPGIITSLLTGTIK